MIIKTDVTRRLALVFVFSLGSFSFGTYLAKKYIDSQHQFSNSDSNKPVEELVELKSKNQTDTKPIEVQQNMSAIVSTPAKLEKVEQPRQPEQSMPVETATINISTDSSNLLPGRYTVQISSYDDEDDAQRAMSQLKDKGYSAFYIPVIILGKTWFRVSIGQFEHQKEANEFRIELLKSKKVSSAIVQKILK